VGEINIFQSGFRNGTLNGLFKIRREEVTFSKRFKNDIPPGIQFPLSMNFIPQGNELNFIHISGYLFTVTGDKWNCRTFIKKFDGFQGIMSGIFIHSSIINESYAGENPERT